MLHRGSTVFVSSVSNATFTNSGTIENKAGVDGFALGLAWKWCHGNFKR